MAATASPPKPWERAKASGFSASDTTTSGLPQTNQSTAASNSSSAPPALPEKSSSLSAVVNRTASNYSPYNNARFGASTYGASPYSSYGGYGNYSSPYSRFGNFGSSMYGGGYGNGYGSMYGGFGNGMYGGGMMGQPGTFGADPNDPNSLTNTFSQSTQATFQMIEGLVGAFGGVAQMLESTYMATQSSFFAMLSVAEQFSNLKTTLGSILGIFTLARYLRTLFAKLTGRPPPADATSLTPAAFASFQGLSASAGSSQANLLPNGRPTPSKKPFLIFLAAVIGLPYLMAKMIRSLAQSQEEQQRQQSNQSLGPDGLPLPDSQSLDVSQLIFCRALYDYSPPQALTSPHDHGASAPPTLDLSIQKGDLVAVLTKLDPAGQPSEWWCCRSRDGRVGYLPGVYLEEVKRNPASGSETEVGPRKAIEEAGRVNTLTSVLNGGVSGRADSLKIGTRGGSS